MHGKVVPGAPMSTHQYLESLMPTASGQTRGGSPLLARAASAPPEQLFDSSSAMDTEEESSKRSAPSPLDSTHKKERSRSPSTGTFLRKYSRPRLDGVFQKSPTTSPLAPHRPCPSAVAPSKWTSPRPLRLPQPVLLLSRKTQLSSFRKKKRDNLYS